jgi:hypothetical protein
MPAWSGLLRNDSSDVWRARRWRDGGAIVVVYIRHPGRIGAPQPVTRYQVDGSAGTGQKSYRTESGPSATRVADVDP